MLLPPPPFPPTHAQRYADAGIVDVSGAPGNLVLTAKAKPQDIPPNTLGLGDFYVPVSQARRTASE